jgi:pimeloyl-ACP methyl ester carboxylesterase
MSDQETFILDNVHGELHGVVNYPPKAGPHPVVVICHGFKGFMEWGFFPPLADLLVERGFATVCFNFTGSGMRPGDPLVTSPEAFRGATFSNDVADVLRILDAVGHDIARQRVDLGRIALVGHSRGGGAAILAAAEPRWQKRLRALVTWAAVSTFHRFSAFEETWKEQGELPVENARTGQELAMGVEILNDLEGNHSALDIQAAAGRRRVPWLIIHGGGDETVPPSEAEALAEHATGPKELRIIKGANHTFGARHPFTGPSPELITAMNSTQTWLRRYCW